MQTETSSPPVAKIRQRARFPFIWIVPLVATLIGGWMMASALHSRGPLIQISFDSAEGLVAGKKY